MDYAIRVNIWYHIPRSKSQDVGRLFHVKEHRKPVSTQNTGFGIRTGFLIRPLYRLFVLCNPLQQNNLEIVVAIAVGVGKLTHFGVAIGAVVKVKPIIPRLVVVQRIKRRQGNWI
jgi:hypothetical protein